MVMEKIVEEGPEIREGDGGGKVQAGLGAAGRKEQKVTKKKSDFSFLLLPASFPWFPSVPLCLL